jgi:hypothetical protein
MEAYCVFVLKYQPHLPEAATVSWKRASKEQYQGSIQNQLYAEE